MFLTCSRRRRSRCRLSGERRRWSVVLSYDLSSSPPNIMTRAANEWTPHSKDNNNNIDARDIGMKNIFQRRYIILHTLSVVVPRRLGTRPSGGEITRLGRTAFRTARQKRFSDNFFTVVEFRPRRGNRIR